MLKINIYVSVLALLFLVSCGSKEAEKATSDTFLVTNPLIKDTLITKEYVCQIHSISHIELRALERGYLQNIYVDEGQFVKKGQLMFQIMPMVYKAEMERAHAEANYAEIEYINTKQLAEKNVVSQNELALTKAKFNKAKAELALAQVRLGFTEIRAPFDGFMDRFQVRQGSLLDEGDLLTTLSDNSQMWVYFNVPEAEYLDYQTKMMNDKKLKVKLLMANQEIYDYDGIVETIEADFNNETGNIAFRATFPNPKKLLRHGETGNIIVNVPMKKAMIIPQKATFEVLDKKYVYVLDKDNIIHSRKISIISELPDLYIIKPKLKPNDKILLEGIRKVTDHQKIKFKIASPDKVLQELQLHAE